MGYRARGSGRGSRKICEDLGVGYQEGGMGRGEHMVLWG